MFSLVDPTETSKVSVGTCENLWEYTDFTRDVDNILDISNPRNTLTSRRRMDEKIFSTRERRVNVHVTLCDDYYISVFMPICTPKISTSDRIRLLDTYMFNSNKIMSDKVVLRVGNTVDTTDYVSCVFVRENPSHTYTRNDTTLSGRCKLDVKS